jgi:tetratricopeptide (TPR) repeat protein
MLYERALEMYRQGEELLSAGQPVDSLKCFEQAANLLAAVGAKLEETICRRHIAMAYERAGRLGRALTVNRRCRAVFESLGNRREVAYAERDIARIMVSTMHGREAVPLYRSALAIEDGPGEARWRVATLAEFGALLISLGSVEEGLAVLKERLARASSDSERERRLAELDLILHGRRQQSPAETAALIEPHLPFFESLGDWRSTSSLLGHLSHLEAEAGHQERAYYRSDQRMKLLASRPVRERATAIAEYGELLMSLGRLDEAADLFTEALSIYDPMENTGEREIVLRRYAALRARNSRFPWLVETWILLTDGFRQGFAGSRMQRAV